ncbi:ran-binding protein M homolog [Actinidia eriantha]|uniref:ran-binding protein M homolog n=1 Tax=Actinidia eriantha TaxID=165200 RepID=UPI0025857989|nr:ran-binding protein M homolog [Actinidia eriantha]
MAASVRDMLTYSIGYTNNLERKVFQVEAFGLFILCIVKLIGYVYCPWIYNLQVLPLDLEPNRKIHYRFFPKTYSPTDSNRFCLNHESNRESYDFDNRGYGYHGDDGLLYHGQGKGDTFGPTYTAGDTVGAGINYASQEFFFTKNGAIVGTLCKDVKGPLFPTIAVHSQNEEVRVNFGKELFFFDLKAFEAQERAKQQMMIEKMSLPQNVSHGIVRSYLLHYGYEDTVKFLNMASKNSLPPISLAQENDCSEQDIMYALNRRKALREDETSATCFLLHCQKYIELVRAGMLEDAVAYGRAEFERFCVLEEYNNLVKDCAALLAYEQPQKSWVGYLLKESQQEIVADTVNAMILSTNPNVKDSQNCLHSYLERLLKQLTTCYLERRSLNGDQGEAFHLRSVLDRGNTG